MTILEVSQKQAYIFASNKLKDNVTNSAVIAWVMSPKYFEEKVNDREMFSVEKNLVYSGGGHTVLEFSAQDAAVRFTGIVTTAIRKEYPGLEVFATTLKYEGKDAGTNLKALTAALEKKKAERKAAFHQGSFGVELMDTNTLTPVLAELPETMGKMPETEVKTDEELSAEKFGFQTVTKFEELGGSKGKSNFIAVVHIDGNAMGKRVENLSVANRGVEWEAYKKKLRVFSDSIDRDFKDAYREMIEIVAKNLSAGKLSELDLTGKNFPVRRVITAGDDVCFVCDGRIGLECAVAYIKALEGKVNEADHAGYAACAGVAIVHQKYPFYRAYELAEQLCSNAKRFGVNLNRERGGEISSIDWHIEYGEMKDSVDEIRESYQTADGHRLEMRPYIICGSEDVIKEEPYRRYANFRELAVGIQRKMIDYSRVRLKELRTVLKQGEIATEYYLKFHRIEDIVRVGVQNPSEKEDNSDCGTGEGLERKMFLETSDGKRRAILFDVIEAVDSFIALSTKEGADGE